MFKICGFLFLSLILCSRVYASDPASDRLSEIASVLQDAGYINVPTDCLEQVALVDSRASRRLDNPTLIVVAVGYMESTGRKLERRSPRCFTCSMQVLTPSGYRRLDQLALGDEIMSWHEDQQRLVVNHVSAIHRADDVPFGELSAQNFQGISLQVTAEHPFLIPEESTYREIGQIHATQFLLSIEVQNESCEIALVPRGEFVPKASGTVITFSVEAAPNNFIVNGIVVHNKPIIQF